LSDHSNSSPVLQAIEQKLTGFYGVKNKGDIRKAMHLSTLPIFHMNHQPHISGYQFAFMVSGDWIDDATQYLGREDLGFPHSHLYSQLKKSKQELPLLSKRLNTPIL